MDILNSTNILRITDFGKERNIQKIHISEILINTKEQVVLILDSEYLETHATTNIVIDPSKVNSPSPTAPATEWTADALRTLLDGYISSNVQKVEGDTAHDSVDTGNPVKIGGKASTSKPTAVSNGDRVNAYLDQYGRFHTFDEGGGGIGGGGYMTYDLDTDNSKGQGKITPAEGSTFTCSAYSLTIYVPAIIKIDHYNSSGVFQGTYDPKQYVITESSGVITVTGVTFAATDLVIMWIEGAERTTSLDDNSQMTNQLNTNPLHEQATTLADTVTLDTTQYYHYYFSGDTFHYFYLRLRAVIGAGSSATLKIWASNKTSPTFPTTGAPAAADWQDVSNDVLRAASVAHAAGANDTPYFVDTAMRPKWWLISYNYTQSADSTIYIRVNQSY